MKKLLFALALVLTLSLAACSQVLDEQPESEETYVTVDINPAVSFIIDEDDNVVLVNPLNKDGEMVLFNLDLVGENIETALDRLIGEAGELGFIDPEAAETLAEIDVIGRDLDIEARVRARVQEALERAFQNRELPVQVRERVYDADFIEEAQQRGLEAREYRLIQQALLADPELSIDEASELDREEIIGRIREHAQNLREQTQVLREEFLDAKQEVFDTYKPQIEALEAQIEEALENEEPTEDLEAELEELKQEMRAELMEVIEDFREQAQSIRDDLLDELEQRRNEFKDRFPR